MGEVLFVIAIMGGVFLLAFLSKISMTNRFGRMSTNELQKRYDELEEHIRGRIAAAEVFCKGKSGSVAVAGHNKMIEAYRTEGKLIRAELAKRGVYVDLSRLDGVAKKAPEKKKASVVGRAVAGGIIAGPTGAIVGAISAAEKNKQE